VISSLLFLDNGECSSTSSIEPVQPKIIEMKLEKFDFKISRVFSFPTGRAQRLTGYDLSEHLLHFRQWYSVRRIVLDHILDNKSRKVIRI
jgi:hypothetical protein